MATQTLFASPGALPLSAAQGLSPGQSLAVVDIFVNAAIACICHTRELIPWDSACFKTRYIDDLNSDFWKSGPNKYSTFCDTEPSIPSVKSQEFRILIRGEDKRADGILDLIETGVFAAVDGCFLEAVRFFITQGGTDCAATDVLESYTLNFSYGNDADTDHSVRSVSINGTPVFTTENAIKSFRKAIRNLLTSLQGLPTMPRQRSLGVAMLYNNKCPTEYVAPGFLTEVVPSNATKQSEWQKLLLQDTVDVGRFEVGPYRVIVGASSVRPSIEVLPNSQMRDLKTSKLLQSLQKSSSQRRSGLVSTLDDAGTQSSRYTPAASNLRSDVCSPVPSSQPAPRTSAMKSSQRRRGFATPAIQVLTYRSRKRNVVPAKFAELLVQACALEANQQGNVFDLKALQQNQIVRLKASLGSAMRCECGDSNNAGELLICKLCGTSQHVECYGWAGFPGVRLPDEHFCYSCLLLPHGTEANAQMGTLVYKRLALSYVQHNNPTDATALMRAMHLSHTVTDDNQIFNSVLDELQRDKYLARAGTAIVATMDEDSSALALREYINPLAQISNHFKALKDGETDKHREKAIAAAVNEYTAGRYYLPGHDVDYVREDVEDAFGAVIPRWGFHDNESRKRKVTTPPVAETPHTKRFALTRNHSDEAARNPALPPYQTALARKASYHEGTPPADATPPSLRSPLTRKASRCEDLVRLDRSSPSTVFSLEDVMSEAVLSATSQVQWADYAKNGRSRRGDDASETDSIPHSSPMLRRC